MYVFTGKGLCDICPGGYACHSNNSFPYGLECPSGHFCPPGTEYTAQYPCEQGTYNGLVRQNSSSACLLCPPGQYCEGAGLSAVTGDCSPGWFCSGGAVQSKPLVVGNAHLNTFICCCFLVPASAPRLVYQSSWYGLSCLWDVLSCLWDGAYKRTIAVNWKE